MDAPLHVLAQESLYQSFAIRSQGGAPEGVIAADLSLPCHRVFNAGNSLGSRKLLEGGGHPLPDMLRAKALVAQDCDIDGKLAVSFRLGRSLSLPFEAV